MRLKEVKACRSETQTHKISISNCYERCNEIRGRNHMIVYTVRDIQKILKISKTKAYELVDGTYFPVKRIGKSIRISKEVFDNWLSK
jgi:excisionase family DNA binding protein